MMFVIAAATACTTLNHSAVAPATAAAVAATTVDAITRGSPHATRNLIAAVIITTIVLILH
jgi:hypothetical protein